MPRIAEQTEWLSLIDVSGPFLAGKVLEETFPQGLDKIETPRRQRLRAAYDEWWDAVDEDDRQLEELHEVWTRMVIREALEYDDQVLVPRGDLDDSTVYRSAEQGVEERPDFAVRTDDGTYRLLITIYPPETDLEKPLKGSSWPASPMERMTSLCRACDVRLGLITNGEQWMLVNAPVGSTSGYASWFARIWAQEPVTLKAFVSLLGVRRCFGPEEGRLDQLLEQSLAFQEEVTDTLGEQVRRAVEVLVQSLGRADQDRNGQLLKDVRPEELYEAGLTVMMRLVFILCAEERDLLLLGDPVYDQHYAISTLRARLREDADRYGVEVLERRHDAWSRILSVFRMVYGGVQHESLRMPALGGSLFDPDRFPFLEGRSTGSSWRHELATPLPIDNRTVLLLMNALQILERKGGAQLLSYRALDVEQIGHVYEGLLEYTVARLPEPTVALTGSKKVRRPTITISELERIATETSDIAAKTLAELTGRSTSAVKKALAGGGDQADLVELIQACGGDEELAGRLLPFAPLIQTDSWGTLLVYRDGAFAIVPGTDRRETGTHYTPRSLTETIVERTLEPIVYVGPADGLPREEWKLRAPAELLDLKICDPAMGSGAFLVEACRYLSQRLVEAWQREEDAGRQVTVEGEVVERIEDRELLPTSLDDRLILARRLIADRCLYGVDKNPLAVELAKLSIWLVTLSKNRPFAFLDHALRSGDSLVGLSNIRQLEQFALKEEDSVQSTLFGNMTQIITNVISAARMQRNQLERLPSNTVADIEAKERLFKNVQRQTLRLKYLADVIIAAYWEGGRQNQIQSRLQVAFHDHIDRFRDGSPEEHSARARTVRSKADCPTPFHWPVEFPEVFQRESGGFDAIVGNPPFAEGKSIAAFKSYYNAVYAVTQANTEDAPASTTKTNLVAVFAERNLIALRDEGALGMVMPKPFLRNERYWRFRFLITDRTRLLFVINFPANAFSSASVETCALVVLKSPDTRNSEAFMSVDLEGGVRRESERALAPILRDRYRTIRVSATSLSIQLMERLCSGMATLNDFYDSKDGINPGRRDFRPYLLGHVEGGMFIPDAFPGNGEPLPHPLAAPEPFDEDVHKPTLRGRDFAAFSELASRNAFLRYDERIAYVEEFFVAGTKWSVQLREQYIYERPVKVVTRQTAPTLIATLDREVRYPINNVHVHFPREDTDCRYSCELLVAILNSRLMRFVYQAISEETGNVFPQVHLSKIRRLPIPRELPDSTTMRIVQNVDRIRRGEQVEKCVSDIDECVFGLYGIDGDERNYVQTKVANAIEGESAVRRRQRPRAAMRTDFSDRVDIQCGYRGIVQGQVDSCVFASNAAAVNHLAGRQVWTEQSLIDECVRHGETQGGPGVGAIAHKRVARQIGYEFNTKGKTELTNERVREWVERESKIVILSRPLACGGSEIGWHMLTLVAWDSDHYIAWDTAGKMSVVYEDEIEQEIPYQNGSVLVPHPNHDAFVYWKLSDDAKKQDEQVNG